MRQNYLDCDTLIDNGMFLCGSAELWPPSWNTRRKWASGISPRCCNSAPCPKADKKNLRLFAEEVIPKENTWAGPKKWRLSTGLPGRRRARGPALEYVTKRFRPRGELLINYPTAAARRAARRLLTHATRNAGLFQRRATSAPTGTLSGNRSVPIPPDGRSD